MSNQHTHNLENLTTEANNPASAHIDDLSSLEIVQLMNDEDAGVTSAVRSQSTQIAAAVDVIADRFREGGRLIYVGAGTSGRLGVLDASECPPTFGTSPDLVVGLIAGGPSALTRSIEGAEDEPGRGESDLRSIDASAKDVVVGIATSGRTPYVVGAIAYARRIGASTIGLVCNEMSELHEQVDLMIAPLVGPEVIRGSTRLKAGTATKLVLNMLTTGAMVRIGKTYGNLMVDLQTKNNKLTQRAKRIVAELAGLCVEEAETVLQEAGGDVKTAVVMKERGVSAKDAGDLLSRVEGHLRRALTEDFDNT